MYGDGDFEDVHINDSDEPIESWLSWDIKTDDSDKSIEVEIPSDDEPIEGTDESMRKERDES